LIQAAYEFAKNFGWTLPQFGQLTPAQVTVFQSLLQSDHKKVP
jgi:hypothetical protein